VGADAAADAITRARSLPSLAVGLHLVVVDGRPLLPAASIPDLVDERGLFSERLVLAGCRYFFVASVRRQLEAEIRAQFHAFQDTGLVLDHVNAHHHMHLHPTVLGLIISIGKEYGLTAIRLPEEALIRAGRLNWSRAVLAPWLALMKKRIVAAGLQCNKRIYGFQDSGNMDSDQLLTILRHLPDGDAEVFFHLATGRWQDMDSVASHYKYEQEHALLIDPETALAVQNNNIQLISFRDLGKTVS